MRTNMLAAFLGAILLAGCTTSSTPPAVPALPPPAAPPPVTLPGLDRVIGKDVTAVLALFGDPDLDQPEPGARKLQFRGPICVLDVYFYAKMTGATPLATYVDARTLNGEDFDRASCIAALTRRREAR